MRSVLGCCQYGHLKKKKKKSLLFWWKVVSAHMLRPSSQQGLTDAFRGVQVSWNVPISYAMDEPSTDTEILPFAFVFIFCHVSSSLISCHYIIQNVVSMPKSASYSTTNKSRSQIVALDLFPQPRIQGIVPFPAWLEKW